MEHHPHPAQDAQRSGVEIELTYEQIAAQASVRLRIWLGSRGNGPRNQHPEQARERQIVDADAAAVDGKVQVGALGVTEHNSAALTAATDKNNSATSPWLLPSGQSPASPQRLRPGAAWP